MEWRGVEKLRETLGGRCALADPLIQEPEKVRPGQTAATEAAGGASRGILLPLRGASTVSHLQVLLSKWPLYSHLH